MKTRFILSVLISVILFFYSCKKDKNDPEPEPEPVPTGTYNPPPAGGDFYMVHTSGNGLSWTKNFTDFKEFSSKFSTAYYFGFAGDTLLVYNDNKVSFGNIYNPSDFKTVNCSKSLNSLSWLKGTIVCTAQDGNNYYVGSCAYKSGQTEMQFTLLSSGVQIYRLQHIGFAVVSSANVNNVGVLAITKDGINWSFKGLPSATSWSNYYTHFKNYNNTIHAYENNGYYSSVDTSFASSSWTSYPFYMPNTSDSAGYYESNFLRKQGNSWISFGQIHLNTGKIMAAKNISTNDGQTFNTTLLSGIPIKPYSYSPKYALTKTHAMAAFFEDGSYKYYVSSDFKNFTPFVPANQQIYGQISDYDYFE